MTTQKAENTANQLPIRGNLKYIYISSLTIAVLMTFASLAGLLYPTELYPTDELLQTFVPNDVVNLIIVVPILLGSMWFARSDKLIGLLFWPGALFFVVYSYIMYVLSIPVNDLYLVYLILATLSIYSMPAIISRIDGPAVKSHLSGHVYERVAGAALAGLAIAFNLRVIGIFIETLIYQNTIPPVELSLLVVDFLFSPAWIIGGVLLWRRKEFGYVVGVGLLFQVSMMFIGLIIFLLVQPLITTAPFSAIDVIVTLLLAMICIVPFILFIRGIVSKHTTTIG